MSLTADQLRHEAMLQRVATGLLKTNVYPSLADAYKSVREILLAQEEIKSAAQLNRITKAISKSVTEIYSAGWQEATKELQSLAVYESSYYAELIGKWNDVELSQPGSKTILDYVNAALMTLTSGNRVDVGTWQEFVDKNISGYAEQVNNLVKAGYTKSATVKQTAAAIRQYSEGLAQQHAETLARTGLSHYANQARRAMADDNKDIIDKEYPLVMFDNRRSIICSSIYMKYKDGWNLNESPIGYPPYHQRCRTIIIYGVKGMGDPRVNMPAIGAGDKYPEDADKKPTYKGRKDLGKFEISQVKYGTDLDIWMKDQGFAFVADNLGETRAKLLMDGKLSLARMTDIYGRPLTIEQLKTRDRQAFIDAGLDPDL